MYGLDPWLSQLKKECVVYPWGHTIINHAIFLEIYILVPIGSYHIQHLKKLICLIIRNEWNIVLTLLYSNSVIDVSIDVPAEKKNRLLSTVWNLDGMLKLLYSYHGLWYEMSAMHIYKAPNVAVKKIALSALRQYSPWVIKCKNHR